MTIGDFMAICLDEELVNVEIWSLDDDTTLVKDVWYNISQEWEDAFFESWNPIEGGICFNV